jgi:hypothetical protein
MTFTATEFEIGFLFGLLVGEGSFTGDQKKAAIQVRMHKRHYPLLLHMCELWGGKVYGPYLHDGRHAVVWMVRGKDLLRLLVLLDDHLHRVPDEKIHTRWRKLKKRYGLSQ